MTTTMTREKVTQLKITICAVVAIFLQSVTLQKKRRKQKRNVKSFLKLTTDWSHWNKIITCLVLIGLRTDLRHRCSHCMEVWAPVQENCIVCTRHKHFFKLLLLHILIVMKSTFYERVVDEWDCNILTLSYQFLMLMFNLFHSRFFVLLVRGKERDTTGAMHKEKVFFSLHNNYRFRKTPSLSAPWTSFKVWF